MGILSKDLHNINFDVNIGLMAWHNKFKQRKAFKKDISKGLIPAVWHLTRWWDWCLLEDDKKEIEPIFADKVGRKQNLVGSGKKDFSVY